METTQSLKERLILAGIEEIRRTGISQFSMRKVASACGVSCAAPYKYFADKSEFILMIIDYVNEEWHAIQTRVAEKYEGDTRRQLVEISMAYVDFLLNNPSFRSIIMLRDDSLTPEQVQKKSRLSSLSARLIHQYCREVNMPHDVEVRKTFLVRSVIYGAALMMDNGEFPITAENAEVVRRTIDREFDLP